MGFATYSRLMNTAHEQLCGSLEWAGHLRDEVLTPLLEGVELGTRMLELGPGPGAATEFLRSRVGWLTALELDPVAAGALEARFAGDNVTVLVGDCVRPGFEDGSFDSVAAFTMFHHIPTSELQRSVLVEAFRILRPGGVLVGSDSIGSNELHHFHADDTYNPVDPSWLLLQLQTIGFRPVSMTVADELTFTARKPPVNSMVEQPA
jgi:SAM-dependent methyltransferase